MEANERSVLVVDDDIVILKMMKLFLKESCKVYAVKGGENAMDFLGKKTPGIIFLDYEMPGMKGPEVLQRIREKEETARIPVYFMTGNTGAEEVAECMKLEPAGYIAKPINRDLVMEALREVFGDGE